MKIAFQDQNFSFEFLRLLGESIHGGSDINECFATAARIREGDYESWYQEWNHTAEPHPSDRRALSCAGPSGQRPASFPARLQLLPLRRVLHAYADRKTRSTCAGYL